LSRNPIAIAPRFTLVFCEPHVFSRLDLCYNTGDEFNREFDWDFVPRFDYDGCRYDDNWLASESACKSKGRCGLDLSQLLDRVARMALQGCLQEMRILSELFRFLLSERRPRALSASNSYNRARLENKTRF